MSSRITIGQRAFYGPGPGVGLLQASEGTSSSDGDSSASAGEQRLESLALSARPPRPVKAAPDDHEFAAPPRPETAPPERPLAKSEDSRKKSDKLNRLLSQKRKHAKGEHSKLPARKSTQARRLFRKAASVQTAATQSTPSSDEAWTREGDEWIFRLKGMKPFRFTEAQRPIIESFINSPLYALAVGSGGSITRGALMSCASKLLNDEKRWDFAKQWRLNLDEAVAICLYKQDVYQNVNGSLRKDSRWAEPVEHEYLNVFCQTMNSGLMRLPDLTFGQDGTATVYRWVGNLPDGVEKTGDTYVDPAYMSTSASLDVGKEMFAHPYCLEITLNRGCGAKAIQELVGGKDEQEILLPMGAQFHVTHIDSSSTVLDNGEAVTMLHLDPLAG